MRFWSFILVIFVAVFAATEAVAVEGASWGQVKASILDEPGPAGKLVVSADRAGDVRYIVYRQPVGGDPRIPGNEYGLPINLSFRTVPGVDHVYAQQDGQFLLIVMDMDADRVDPEALEFGLIYTLGGDQVLAKTRFFGYDAERTQYMVQFSVPYTGSPAQEHILGLRSGEAVISFWYVPEGTGDYDGLYTRLNITSPDIIGDGGGITPGGVTFALIPIGRSRRSDLPDAYIAYWPKRSPLDWDIQREEGVRFYKFKVWRWYPAEDRTEPIGEWIVQLPFVEELDVILLVAPEVAHVGLPRK